MSEIALTSAQSKILHRLRPPSARPLYVAYAYAREHQINAGITFRLEPGEQAVAPGAGKVVVVSLRWASWQHSPGDLESKHSYQVTIDHGQGVWTVVAGMADLSAAVKEGLLIERGTVMGTLVTDECFFQVAVNREVKNPVKINRHFKTFDARYVPGQQRFLRAAADFITRTLNEGIEAVLVAGRHFFENIRQRWLLTLNVDFNGNGSKSGAAAAGETGDFWNVYAAGAFTATPSGSYGYGYGYYYYYYSYCSGVTFNTTPQVFLRTAGNVLSTIWLERIANASGASGSSAWFDPMLSTYIGGAGEENFFAVRGLPAATYDLYVYGNDGTVPNTTTVYVAVDNGTPQVKQTAPTVTPAFIENANYVRFQIVTQSGSTVSVKVYGYLAGLQLIRA